MVPMVSIIEGSTVNECVHVYYIHTRYFKASHGVSGYSSRYILNKCSDTYKKIIIIIIIIILLNENQFYNTCNLHKQINV